MFFGPEGRKYLKTLGRVSTVGIEIVISTFVGLGGGWWLDQKFGTSPWITIIGFVFGLAAGFRSLYRVAREMTRPSDDTKQDPS